MTPPTQIETIASLLRARRRELKLTQQAAADLAGVSVRFVHDVEAGKPSAHLGKLVELAETLGLELALVARRTDVVDPSNSLDG